MKLAVLGDPLAFTRSPELHRAGLGALGLPCESHALRTPLDQLGTRLSELASAGFHGVNLTHPLKEAALAHVARASDAARASRSINTVGLTADGRWGDTTDGAGFLDLLRQLGVDPPDARVVIFGAGGAARSLTFALRAAGASVTVASRDPARASASWSAIPGPPPVDAAAIGEALGGAAVVVNATPVATAEAPVVPGTTPKDALLVDLTYGPDGTAWVAAAHAAGRRAWDGLGLLVHQARHSIMRWTGRDLEVEPLARAVGWRP